MNSLIVACALMGLVSADREPVKPVSTGRIKELVTTACATPASDCAPVPGDPNQKFFDGRSSLSRKVNGVGLEASARFGGDAQSPEIRVEWKLSYNGPRPPLIILEPSLTRRTSGQTALLCYAEGADGKPYEYEHKSPPAQQHVPWLKEWFLTVEKGKSATGKVAFPVADLRSYLDKNWPGQFPADRPLRVTVQLIHRPFDRAEGSDLDPWTGALHSRAVPVADAKK